MAMAIQVASPPTALALETAIGTDGQGRSKDILVWGHLRTSDVLALGHYGPDQQIKDIVYYSVTSSNGPREDLIPIFTRIEFLQQAVQKNPEWAKFEVILVNGGDLVQAFEVDAIVINPWSPLEYRVPRLMANLYNGV